MTRVKLLNPVPYDLDQVALDTAFGMAFTPARDLSGRSIRSMVVWSFEWPAHTWYERYGSPLLLSDEVLAVPCRKSGRPQPERRDCRAPPLAEAARVPWIAAPPPPPIGGIGWPFAPRPR